MSVVVSIQVHRDTAVNWTSVNPVLLAGEPGYETDTGKLKIGDGIHTWTQLAYQSDPAGSVAAETARAEAAEALKAPLASPALTGTPTAPTPTALDDSTKLATTAYADLAVAVEKSRAQGVEGANATAIAAETSRAEGVEATLVPLSQRGAASGVATLDSTTRLPVGQLPLAATTGGSFTEVSSSFPTTGVLDAFGRAAENPLSDGGNWALMSGFSANPLEIVTTGQATAPAGGGTSYWDAATYQSAEVYATVEALGGTDNVELFLRLNNPTGSWTGYRIKFAASVAVVYRSDGTNLGSVNPTISVGDVVGARIVGSTITVWHNGTLILTVNDGTYSGAGYIGAELSSATAAITSFGGGNTVATTVQGQLSSFYVPPPSGSANTDTANVQAALTSAGQAGGGEVVLGVGTYSINASLILYGNTHLRGAGRNASVLQLAAGTNADLLLTSGFYSLTGITQTSSTAGVQGWSITSLTLDGNFNGQTAGINNCWPLRIFGCNYTLLNVDVLNGNSGGVWSEWLTTADPDRVEAHWTNVRVSDYSGVYSANTSAPTYGVYMNGPHDTQMSNVIISSLRSNHSSNTSLTFGLYIGTSAPGTLGTHVHVWGRHTHCVYMRANGNYFVNSYAEGATSANVVMSATSSWLGGLIMGTNGNSNNQPNESGLWIGDNGTSGSAPTGFSVSCSKAQVVGAFLHSFGSQLPAPTGVGAAAVGSGGTFGAGTYYWKVTATNANGETIGSSEVNATLVANGSCNLTWTAVTGATGYKIYRATSSGAENVSPALVAAVGAVTTYTDTGTATSAGAVPGTNTAQAGYSLEFVNDGGANTIKCASDSALTSLSTGSPASTDTLEVIATTAPSSGLFQSQNPSAPGASVQVFTSSGSWTKPSQCSTVQATCIGGGGGGGSGGVAATATAVSGGAGGGAGAFSQTTLPASVISGAQAVTVGAAGTGGAAQTTNSTNGNAGGSGGLSQFGNFCAAGGGGGGGAGAIGAASTGGAGGQGMTNNGTAGVGSASSGAGPQGQTGTGQNTASGGGGGGITTANATSGGSNGGQGQGGQITKGFGGTGVAGGNGTNSSYGGGGGGGGGGSGTAGGFAGGTGGNYGSAGGGGGAAQNGGSGSGAGGAGAPGLVIVATW